MQERTLNIRTGKPLAEYECRDVRQFRKLTGGKRGPGAPEGNANRLRHGIYANRLLSAEEQAVFHDMVSNLREDFSFNLSSDFIQVELAAIYTIKLARAIGGEDWEAASKIDGMLRGHLKDLKLTKIVREGEGRQAPETTPAEWAADLLEKLAAAEKRDQTAAQSAETPE